MQYTTEQTGATFKAPESAPLWRRLLAIFYDAIMVFCVVFIAWQPVPFLLDDQIPQTLSKAIRLAYLFLVSFGFFGWFWTHGGQTIGMRSWQIRLVDNRSQHRSDSQPEAMSASRPGLRNPDWGQALRQYLFALVSWGLGGLGFIAALWHPQKRCWHDRGAGTAMIVERRK